MGRMLGVLDTKMYFHVKNDLIDYKFEFRPAYYMHDIDTTFKHHICEIRADNENNILNFFKVHSLQEQYLISVAFSITNYQDIIGKKITNDISDKKEISNILDIILNYNKPDVDENCQLTVLKSELKKLKHQLKMLEEDEDVTLYYNDFDGADNLLIDIVKSLIKFKDYEIVMQK